jgi:diaminohydroxyphosphoribosylaminopyrimidine deaminase/5-amino-6-(5-phosphoribosylamino)uracil reductase
LILKNKILKVIVACVDPFPEVAGKGIEMLRNQGVEVETGLLQKDAAHMNRRFMTFYTKKRPYIILKWAESANGKIGIQDGSQVNISGAPARSLSHKWRTEEDAILIGKGTLMNDNPMLTNRLREGKNPVKIILAGDLKLKEDYKIFSSDSKVLIFGTPQPDFEFNGKWFQVNTHDLNEIMQTLYNENIQSVIVEGGQLILDSFLKAGLVDEFRIFRSISTMLPENAVSAPKWPAIEFKKTDLKYDELMTAFL